MASDDTEEKLRKLAAVDQKGAATGWLAYLSDEGAARQEVSDLLDVLLFQTLGKDFREEVFLPPPGAERCTGEYRLGTLLYPGRTPHCAFGLREGEWTRHLLITGMTGAGKTNLAYRILEQLGAHRRPFLVFDWKRNYRDLRQLPSMQDVRVFTVGREVAPFRFNPLLPPPGCEPGQWLMKLVDVLKHAYFVGEGVEFLLREGIDWVYDKSGMFAEQTATPTFGRVADYVARKPLQGRMSLWKASTMRVLEALCFRHGLGPVVNCDDKLDDRELLSSSVVLELDALSDTDKVFLTEALILWIYELRKAESLREGFRHALVIEEGHHVLSQLKEHHEGMETIMETCLRQIREFGEAVIVIDQEPTKLSNSIKANTYAKVTFNLGNGRDIDEIAACMSLTDEQRRCIRLLNVGEGIVSLKGRVQTPVLVRFDKTPIEKGKLTDGDLKPAFQSDAAIGRSPLR